MSTKVVLDPFTGELEFFPAAVVPPASDSATPARPNKNMTASATVADGDLAFATAVAVAPATPSTNGGYVGVRINGLSVHVGDGTKVAVDCYFSRDGGTTALALASVTTGDLLYWNGSVAGYQLATSDVGDFDFDTTS